VEELYVGVMRVTIVCRIVGEDWDINELLETEVVVGTGVVVVGTGVVVVVVVGIVVVVIVERAVVVVSIMTVGLVGGTCGVTLLDGMDEIIVGVVPLVRVDINGVVPLDAAVEVL